MVSGRNITKSGFGHIKIQLKQRLIILILLNPTKCFNRIVPRQTQELRR